MGLKESGLRGSLRSVSTDVSVIPDSVVNRWPIDEGSGTTFADAIGTADGTWNGGVWVTNSKFIGGFGYDLNGTEDFGDTGATAPAGSKTIVGTVEFTDLVTGSGRLHGWQDGSSAGGFFINARGGGAAQENTPIATAVDDSGTIVSVEGNQIPVDTPTRIVAVLDLAASELRLAQNGTVVNSAAFSGDHQTQLSNHKVGRRADSADDFLDGIVDEPMVADTAWTSTEIVGDYRRQPWS